MRRLAAVLALGALFTGGAFAASNVPQVVSALETTSTATTTTGTTTGTTTTTPTTTGTTTTPAHKVVICHKPTKKHGGREIVVSRNALPAHMAHGDSMGACPRQTTTQAATTQAATTQATTTQATTAQQPAAKPKKQKAKKQKVRPTSSGKSEQAKPGKGAEPRGNGRGGAKGKRQGRP